MMVGWNIIFYGNSDFKWTEWGDGDNTEPAKQDPSVVPTSLPYTGMKYILYGGIISTKIGRAHV